VHALVIVSGGFGDAGEEGLALQAKLVSDAHRTGMRILGPNALGVINTDPAVRLNASLVTRMPVAGRVGFFCQSGALGSAILERFRLEGLGLSTFVSAGNRADISGNDLLQYWDEDPGTDVVLLYLESIGNARKFARLVHRTARRKPVVMVRTGGTGHAHPLGHAVGSTRLTQKGVDQILADCGLVVVETIDALIDVGRLAAHQPVPLSPGVAIIGNSDALAVMTVNALASTSLAVACPPDTFARQTPAAAFETAMRGALENPEVGSVLAIHVPAVEDEGDEAIQKALRACAAYGITCAKPVLAVMPHGTTDGTAPQLPVFEDVERAVQALDAIARLSAWRDQDAQTSIGDLDVHPTTGVEPVPGTWEGDAAATLLAPTRGGRPRLDLESPGTVGCLIRLLDDPLFGPVVEVGVDDPVAALLDDSAHRLAPVSVGGARAMLESLGAASILTAADPGTLEALAVLVSDVSALHLRAPGVTSATLRHAWVGDGGDVSVGRISVVVSGSAIVSDPAARRI
jgi:acyl-CoA synthetase (NDP forming)